MDEKRLREMGVVLAIEIKTIVLAIPRDRESDFEPQLVKKHQTRIDKINQPIYQVPTQELALQELTHFEEEWDNKYPFIGQTWRRHRENLSPFFVYPKDIRKALYTTNAIELLNSIIRHTIKKRKVFPTDDSVKKVIYLAIQQASEK